MFNRTKKFLTVAALSVSGIVFGACAVGAALNGAPIVAGACIAGAVGCTVAALVWAWFPDLGMP